MIARFFAHVIHHHDRSDFVEVVARAISEYHELVDQVMVVAHFAHFIR